MVCFQTKNSNWGQFLEVLAMGDDGIFYGQLVHFTVYCYSLWTFGIVHFNISRFGILYQEKSGNPGCCQGPEIEHDPPIGHFKFCLSISDSSESFNRFGFLL
jgi:hypothetical protein